LGGDRKAQTESNGLTHEERLARQHARDASEWRRIEAPELRIITDDLWSAVHDRMARRRAVYLDRTGGQKHGRRLTGTVSPYLLTGFVSCGCCAGTLIVRSRPHRRRREARMACYHYMPRPVQRTGAASVNATS